MDGHAQEAKIQNQADKHSNAIGNGTSLHIIENLADFAQDAVLDDFYQIHSEVAFWYQALDKPGWESKVKAVADLWVKVGRTKITCRGRNDKIKRLGGVKWKSMPEGLCMDDEEPQTIVFIALEDLGPENGFPFPLKRGQDVCVDGKLDVLLPPTGGGLGMLIILRL